MLEQIELTLLRLIVLCIAIFTNAGCNIHKSQELVLPIDSRQIVLMASYYQNINRNTPELKLSEKHKEQAKIFNNQEVKIPVQGENFLSRYIGGNVSYYELGQFEYEDSVYKLIVYNKYGESDTLLLNVQLNSYDARGNLIDALLLSTFFCYEDIVRFSEFIVRPDYTITIEDYVIYRYGEGKMGLSEELIKGLTPQLYLKQKYQITKGQFKLISRTENK